MVLIENHHINIIAEHFKHYFFSLKKNAAPHYVQLNKRFTCNTKQNKIRNVPTKNVIEFLCHILNLF